MGRISNPVRVASIIAAAALSSTGLLAPVATAAEITLPPETARFVESPLPGYSTAMALCSVCHSADYVRMQPTFTRTTWKAEVTKMQKVFGAPIPDEAMDPIVDYLVRTYGAERTSSPAQPASAEHADENRSRADKTK
jgi:hypothetical protein